MPNAQAALTAQPSSQFSMRFFNNFEMAETPTETNSRSGKAGYLHIYRNINAITDHVYNEIIMELLQLPPKQDRFWSNK